MDKLQKQEVTLVFLHGLWGHHEDWGEVVKFLDNSGPPIQSTFQSTFVSLPGHGEARELILEGPYWAYVKGKLSGSGGSRKNKGVLVGYSQGGRLWLEWICRHFDPRPQAAILISSAWGWRGTEKQRQIRLQQDGALLNGVLEGVESFEKFLNRWAKQPLFGPSFVEQAFYQGLVQRRLREDPRRLSEALKIWSVAARGHAVGSYPYHGAKGFHLPPVAYLFGEHDPTYGPFGKELKELELGNVYCYAHHKGHHGILWEDPRWVARSIKNFMRTIVSSIPERKNEAAFYQHHSTPV